MFCLIYRMSQSQSLVTSQSVGHSRSRCHISVAFALLGRLHCSIQPSSSKNTSFSVDIKSHQHNQACDVYSWEIAPIYRLLDRIGRSSLPYLITKPSDRLRKLSTSLFDPTYSDVFAGSSPKVLSLKRPLLPYLGRSISIWLR